MQIKARVSLTHWLSLFKIHLLFAFWFFQFCIKGMIVHTHSLNVYIKISNIES